MVSFETSDLKKVGVALTTLGVLTTLTGVIMFFDRVCLTMGNLLFFSGVILTIGLRSALKYLLKSENYKASLSFGAGFFLVLTGWPFIGMIVETYGYIVLFSGFWTTVIIFMKNVPVLGLIIRWMLRKSSAVPLYFNRPKGRRVPV